VPPAREFVLTFDDGYAALASHAFPVLADLGFTALVFVVTDFVGRDNDWDVHYGWRRFRHLSWDELAYWQGRGIEVHAHGASHARLTWLPDERVRDEIGRAREAVIARIGVPPSGLAYPFGAVDERVRRLTAEAGYRLGFAGPSGMRPVGAVGPEQDPLALPRTPIYAWDRWGLPLELRGGLPGAAAARAARMANRLSVATTLVRRLSGAGS
jgi:peptidoglycan/xylan/chitin deacetylase (PgdA/CDA1 family)